MSIERELFGNLGGKEVFAYTMKNDRGMQVKICTYGGAVMQLYAPDGNGNFDDVVCGYSSLESYRDGDGYQGAIIGRLCNRVGKARFSLDGKEYVLFKNDGENSLHGGNAGFNDAIWDAEAKDGKSPALVLHHTFADGEGGYPGTLDTTVTYTLGEDNALSIEYRARSDKKTVVSLTNHTYFNVGGYAVGSIMGHRLFLDADRYLETRDDLVPTGRILPVGGTALDFRKGKVLSEGFDLDSRELKGAGGYDHCLCFTGGDREDGVKLRGILSDPVSGRVMKVFTDQPCVQLYSGNFLSNEKFPFKNGLPQTKRMALCLETQKMPDSVNHENFTDVTLEAGEEYLHRTIYAFEAERKQKPDCQTL